MDGGLENCIATIAIIISGMHFFTCTHPMYLHVYRRSNKLERI